eukprot:gene6039-8315_t
MNIYVAFTVLFAFFSDVESSSLRSDTMIESIIPSIESIIPRKYHQLASNSGRTNHKEATNKTRNYHGLNQISLPQSSESVIEEEETILTGDENINIDNPTQSLVKNSPDTIYAKPTHSPTSSKNTPTVKRPTSKPSTNPSNDIKYNGGAVMLGKVNVYNIWYGSFNTATVSLVNYFTSKLGGSPYFNINSKYYQQTSAKASKQYVSNSLVLAKSVATSSSSFNPSTTSLNSIVSSLIVSQKVPVDTNGIYVVYVGDIAHSGDMAGGCGTSYCGYHSYFTYNGKNLKIALICDPMQTVSQGPTYACGNIYNTVNGDSSADVMVSVVGHELSETVSDPELNAWYDKSGYENADKCAYNYGTYLSGYTNRANVVIGTNKYLIQQNWLYAPPYNRCAISA